MLNLQTKYLTIKFAVLVFPQEVHWFPLQMLHLAYWGSNSPSESIHVLVMGGLKLCIKSISCFNLRIFHFPYLYFWFCSFQCADNFLKFITIQICISKWKRLYIFFFSQITRYFGNLEWTNSSKFCHKVCRRNTFSTIMYISIHSLSVAKVLDI